MQATVKWVDNAMFLGESGSGHSVVMDGPEDHGGRNMGIRPMEMLLLGVGGCASFDVMSILKKSRQQVVDCRVEFTAERAQGVPSSFTKIHLQFMLPINLVVTEILKYLQEGLIKRTQLSFLMGNPLMVWKMGKCIGLIGQV